MLPKGFVCVDKDLNKDHCLDKIQKLKRENRELIKEFHAAKKHAVIVMLQGLDASGKDGIIARCFSKPGPKFFEVHSFKKPSREEALHDFLWRVHKACPPRGVVGVFNRSHYEDILVPQSFGWIDKKEVENRYDSINDFESHLKRCDTHILKFFLNISYVSQGEKLEERKHNPLKRYKHQESDWETRRKWDDFMKSYSGIFKNTQKAFDWINVPADKKWQKDYIVLKQLNKYLKDHN